MAVPPEQSEAPGPPETVEVEENIVTCDGDVGALGHPRVYLNLGADRTAECPYCDRQFVLKEGASPAAH